jgi:hypothetical protein
MKSINPSGSECNIIFHSVFRIEVFKAVPLLNKAIICICSAVLDPRFIAIVATAAYKYYQCQIVVCIGYTAIPYRRRLKHLLRVTR